jgi:hypothetical protein
MFNSSVMPAMAALGRFAEGHVSREHVLVHISPTSIDQSSAVDHASHGDQASIKSVDDLALLRIGEFGVIIECLNRFLDLVLETSLDLVNRYLILFRSHGACSSRLRCLEWRITLQTW